MRYTGKPPYTAEQFWDLVLSLLNEKNGSVTQERLERTLGVRFPPPDHQSDEDVYALRAGKDWYFDVRLTLYNDRFRFPLAPQLNGPHVEWSMAWGTHSFGDPCVTDEHVRATLLANGWTSPWQKWGLWEEVASHTKAGSLSTPPVSNFLRQSDEDAGHRDRLPSGSLQTTGDFPFSCVTAIRVTAPK